jgi:hypothetical protein
MWMPKPQLRRLQILAIWHPQTTMWPKLHNSREAGTLPRLDRPTVPFGRMRHHGQVAMICAHTCKSAADRGNYGRYPYFGYRLQASIT